MTTKTIRKVVKIDDEKCDGCGNCVLACAEGALQIIDGKARLISENYCDGLGDCLGECPQDAIIIEEREAEEFDEVAVEEHLHSTAYVKDVLPCGCPSANVAQFEKRAVTLTKETGETIQQSRLTHWPVQLTLVPPFAPFLQGADIVLAADCSPFAYAGFHRDILKDNALLVACPKLDNFQAHQSKLTEILRQAEPKSITVVHMEVPCCSGLVHMARQAILDSGKDIPFEEITIGVHGNLC